MDNQSLDKTTLTTISLLEARLLRVEQVLYGTTSTPTPPPSSDSALESMADLERRFSTLVSRFRVYADILKLCTRTLFTQTHKDTHTSITDTTTPLPSQTAPTPASLPPTPPSPLRNSTLPPSAPPCSPSPHPSPAPSPP